MRFRSTLLVFAVPFFLSAQELPILGKLPPLKDTVDADRLTAAFHTERRQALRALLPERGVAMLEAATLKTRSNDVSYEYHQDPDLYYLTGVTEPEAVLFVFKEPRMVRGASVNELLVVRDRDPASEVWTGKRLGVDGARSVSGVASVVGPFQLSSMDGFLTEDDVLHRIDPAATDAPVKGEWPAVRRVKDHALKGSGLSRWMAELREVKRAEEMVLLRKAIDITCEAERMLMRSLVPGMTEYQAEAVVQYVFSARGAEHEGYPSILGGAAHSCVLHYETNRGTLKAGDLLVSDVGAEYHGYTADVTRTLPVSGTFTTDQAAIYDLVLKAQEAGIAAVQVGAPFHAAHHAATEVITKGLLELGIIKEASQVRRYFMHGTSHYLGLDVHDAGRYGLLAEGNLITVEPGIYIAEGSPCDPRWWNIGVRIEDDILVTAQGPENLSACVPRSRGEVEALMASPLEALPLPR